MGGVWTKLTSWFDSNAARLVVTNLDDPAAAVADIRPGQSYVRLWLSDFFLAKDKRWARSQVPMVQTQVELEVEGGPPVTFAKVARPPEAMVGPGDRIDYPLSPLLPYRGKLIELTAGLTALKGPSSLKAAIDTLQQFSSLAGAPFEVAAAIARTVADGVERLSEAAEAEVVLGLHRSFIPAGGGGGNVLKPGYIALVRAEDHSLASRLTIQGSRLHVNGSGGSQPLEGYDFLVFHIEGRDERPDWEVGELGELLTGVVDAIVHGREDAAELERKLFSLVLTTPELVDSDRTRVVDRLQGRLHQARTMVGKRGAGPVAPISLNALMRGAIPRHVAALRPVPSLDEALSYQ